MIKVSGLTKSFNGIKAVDGISFEISKGEIVGLLGPNGAGKTTTMRMMTGFLLPDSGDAQFDKTSIGDDPDGVKSRIGYLPESAPLYTDMVVEDYLYFMGRARGVSEDDLPEAVQKMVDACQLSTHYKKTIGQLSKGFRQRVGLAATMIHDPDVLILDEPTTGLDPNQIAEIRKLIIELGKEKTVILSTHIMQEVQETCNRVLIISQGQLVADDNVTNLTTGRKGQIEMAVAIKGNDVLQTLKNQNFVVNVEAIQTEIEGATGVKLFSERNIGEDVFDLCVSRGWKILEMHTSRKNLESVFRELTTTSQGA